jgi:hypothetical protein
MATYKHLGSPLAFRRKRHPHLELGDWVTFWAAVGAAVLFAGALYIDSRHVACLQMQGFIKPGTLIGCCVDTARGVVCEGGLREATRGLVVIQ